MRFLFVTIGLLSLSGCASNDFIQREMDRAVEVAAACSAVQAKSSSFLDPTEILAIRFGVRAEERSAGHHSLATAAEALRQTTDITRKFRDQLDPAAYVEVAAKAKELDAKARVLATALRALRHQILISLEAARPEIRQTDCKLATECLRKLSEAAQRVETSIGSKYDDVMAALGSAQIALLALKTASSAASVPIEQDLSKIESALKQAGTLLHYFETTLQQPFDSTDQALFQHWVTALEEYLTRRAEAKAAELILNGIDRASASVERLIDKVDDKAWFVGELALIATRDDIVNSIARGVESFSNSMAEAGDTQGSRDVRAAKSKRFLCGAVAVAACARVGTPDTSAATSQSVSPRTGTLVGVALEGVVLGVQKCTTEQGPKSDDLAVTAQPSQKSVKESRATVSSVVNHPISISRDSAERFTASATGSIKTADKSLQAAINKAIATQNTEIGTALSAPPKTLGSDVGSASPAPASPKGQAAELARTPALVGRDDKALTSDIGKLIKRLENKYPNTTPAASPLPRVSIEVPDRDAIRAARLGVVK